MPEPPASETPRPWLKYCRRPYMPHSPTELTILFDFFTAANMFDNPPRAAINSSALAPCINSSTPAARQHGNVKLHLHLSCPLADEWIARSCVCMTHSKLATRANASNVFSSAVAIACSRCWEGRQMTGFSFKRVSNSTYFS